MKGFIKFTCIGLAVSGLIALSSCSKSTEPEKNYDFPEPLDSVANDITLSIHSAVWDTLLATTELITEGTTIIEFGDSSYLYHAFNIYAEAEGFYTELYFCRNGDTVTVDLDAVPTAANAITGVIIGSQDMWPHYYYADGDIEVGGPENLSLTIRTDQQGRFGLGNLPNGTFQMSINRSGWHEPIIFQVENAGSIDYRDLLFVDPAQLEAPYLYLYPQTEMDITIELGFPQGGQITESEPPYGSGWNVHVTPDGVIEGQYSYLFYEGVISVPFNHECAWLLDGNDLENEMRNLLVNLSFEGREIDDFVDFWVPIIEGSPWYAFFPQDVESIITLDITPIPDNILRALFFIYPLEQPLSIPEPEIPVDFTRDGFTVVEWGVIGWHD